jgi:hypothetical protein
MTKSDEVSVRSAQMTLGKVVMVGGDAFGSHSQLTVEVQLVVL